MSDAPPSNTPPAGDWTSALDDDSRGFVELRQWKDPSALVKSYRELERLKGAPPERLATIPDKGDDVEGWNALYSKLGRPETADKYEIPMPKEGGSPEFEKWARGTFHELGLSAAQGRALVEKWNEFAGGLSSAQEEADKASFEAEQAALKKEWGAVYDQNVAAAKAAAAQLGLSKEAIDKLEGAVGFTELMRHLYTVGTKFGEDAFVSGEGKAGAFGLTPGAAKAKIRELQQDTGFATRLAGNDVKALEEWDKLHKIAFPDAA